MKKREIQRYEFVLEPQDIGTIKKCLDYCWHRLKKHKKCGIKGIVETKVIERLRNEIIS